MKRYMVTAQCFGMIKDGFASRSAAYRFARKWERDEGWGRGVASVDEYVEE